MVQSLNTKVDFTIEATSYLGIASYGKVMVGDKPLNFIMKKISEIIFKFHGKKLTILRPLSCLKVNGFLALQLRLKIMEDLRFQHVIIRRYYVQ